MSKFYFFLWLKWAIRVSTCSVVMALFFSFLITGLIYINEGLPTLHVEVYTALFDIIKFWFPILWSLTLLLALFRSLKYIFNICNSGYKLELLTCKRDEVIEFIGYGDLLKVWRKWFMLIIWLVGAHMILAIFLTYMLSNFNGIFEWFDIYWLFAFVLSSGYFSFVFLGSRCKSVKVVKC